MVDRWNLAIVLKDNFEQNAAALIALGIVFLITLGFGVVRFVNNGKVVSEKEKPKGILYNIVKKIYDKYEENSNQDI